jgi:hypothetical protein
VAGPPPKAITPNVSLRALCAFQEKSELYHLAGAQTGFQCSNLFLSVLQDEHLNIIQVLHQYYLSIVQISIEKCKSQTPRGLFYMAKLQTLR